MKKRELDKYFEKMYISSIYGTKKEYGDFFDYRIKEFNIEIFTKKCYKLKKQRRF